MGNFLRLVHIVGRALLGPRRQLLRESVITLRVWPNDLDTNLHMNNGRYLSLMDLGRVDLMLEGGVAVWLRRGWQPVVAASFCRHFKPLNLFQAYEIRTRVLGWDDKWIYFEHRFTRRGVLHALGAVKGLVVDGARTVPTPELIAALGHEPVPSPALPGWVREWLRSERSAIDQLKAEAAGRP